MIHEEFEKLESGDTVWLALPFLSCPVRGKIVDACLTDVASKAHYGVQVLRKNIWLRWIPRSNREFMKRVFLRKEDAENAEI